MSKRLYAILTIAILALLPLMADNQVVMSTRAQSLTSSAEADDTLSWQGYTDQLGLSVPVTMDYDLLQTKHLVTARGDASYPVTPGDIYQLNYLYNGSLVTVPVAVTHSDEVSVANIGSFSRLGKTFDEFRREVEGAVTSRYPYSSPSLSLTATGSFTVRVAGYVTSSQAVDAWGLTRLSDLAWYASDMASTRDVVVTHSDGASAHYDLYAARLGGDSSQDPCLRAGDTVTFTRRGTTVTIAGSVAEAYFGGMVRTGFTDRKKDVVQSAGSMLRKKPIEQAHFALGFPTVAREDKMRPAVQVMNAILGGGMSSRLFKKVREELGLAYSVYSYCSHYAETGMLTVYAGVSPAKAKDAFAAVQGVIESFKREGVTEEEFSRGREQVKSGSIFSQENTSSQMLLYGKEMLYNNAVYDFERRMAEIAALTRADVMEAIKQNFDFSRAAVAAVGNLDEGLSL